MGLAGLTAVFGMGTGVAPPVWSPGRRPADVSLRRSRQFSWIAPVKETFSVAYRSSVDHLGVMPKES